MNILDYYNSYDEDERLSKGNSNKIEFLTTVEKLKKYIGLDSKILELGCATGQYSLYYNNLGNCVTAVDLVPKHIEIINEKIKNKNLKKIKAYVGNATDLSFIPDETYDCVLCLGPLYHLSSDDDQDSCIKECFRVLKRNGIIAVAYVNKHYIVTRAIKNSDKFLNKDFIDKVVTNGVVTEKDDFWTECNFFDPGEIEELMGKYSFQKLHNIGTDGAGRLFQEFLDDFSNEKFNTYLNYHLEHCENPYLLGYSNHGLYIGKK